MCVEHVLSVERLNILVKGDAAEEGHEPVVIDLAWGSTAALTLPVRQRACEINCICNLINYEIK